MTSFAQLTSFAQVTGFAQVTVERLVNTLPEGLLIAVCAWMLLRLVGRANSGTGSGTNSGTRFAVWLVALGGVMALPVFRGFGGSSRSLFGPAHTEFTVPATWAVMFLILWAVVAMVALARVSVGIWQVRQLRRSCRDIAAADLDPSLQEVLAGMRRPVRLLVSEEVRVPAAIGFLKPAIILPEWTLRELSDAELRPILIHELTHLRRHDDWTNLLQKAARAVFFFHPAVWWIDARLSLERELACDDAVLAATGNPRAYAGCLIDLLERGCARRGWAMAQAAVARARDASVRIARILEAQGPATTRVGRAALAMTASLSLGCAALAVFVPGLVGFAPNPGATAARMVQPVADRGVGFAASSVIPAAWHPSLKTAQALNGNRDLRGTQDRRRALTRSGAMRHVVASHSGAAPVVLARLDRAAVADRAIAEPALVIFTEAEGGAGMQSGSMPAANEEQSGVGAAFTVQMLQVVQESQASPRFQVFRLVLIVPAHAVQQGSAAQSI